MDTTKKFGNFKDGDVLITSSTGKTWKLHAGILRQHSTVLRKLFEEHAPVKLSKKKKFEGKTIMWKINMINDPTPGGLYCIFKYINPKAKTKSDDLFQNTNGLGGPPAWLKTYDNLFRALYSIEVEFSDESLDEFLTDATCLLQAAENLGAEKSISRVLETHLLRAGQPFWHTVRDDPGKWTDVATRIESPVIYREAMIHLVGAWNMVPDSIDNPIDKEVIRSYKGGAIIEAAVLAKIKGQTEEKRCIEKSLVEHFPPAMIHQTVQVVNKAGKAVQKPPTRQNYAEDIYLWQALCLVRMYITTEIRHNGSFREIDGGASFFRSIAAGGNAYLQPQTIENYFNMMHMTERGKICFCNALYDLKNAMKHIVAPLVVNNSCVLQDDGKPMQHEYLTHTTISDKELPWNVKPAGENPMEAEMNRDNMIICWQRGYRA